MADLPNLRTIFTYAFDIVGIYFARLLNVQSKIRCHTFTKFYLELFICFTTKAVHLERVDSTDDFLMYHV